jgi:hypothetical protein
VFDTLLDAFDRDRRDAPRGRSSGLRGMLGRVLDDDRPRRDDRRRYDQHDDDDELGWERRRPARRGSAFDWD